MTPRWLLEPITARETCIECQQAVANVCSVLQVPHKLGCEGRRPSGSAVKVQLASSQAQRVVQHGLDAMLAAAGRAAQQRTLRGHSHLYQPKTLAERTLAATVQASH